LLTCQGGHCCILKQCLLVSQLLPDGKNKGSDQSEACPSGQMALRND